MTSSDSGDSPDPWNRPPPYGQGPFGETPYVPPDSPYGTPQPPYGAYPGGPMPPAGPPYGYGYPAAPVPGGRLAGMGARFGGLVLDTIIIGVPTAIIGIFTNAYRTTDRCDASGTCTHSFAFSANLPLDLIALVLGMAYAAFFVGTQGQTLGHRAARIKVVDVESGALIGPWRASLRWLVMAITGAVCTLGYWSPFFDSRRRQGWHDKVSNSVVIPAKDR